MNSRITISPIQANTRRTRRGALVAVLFAFVCAALAFADSAPPGVDSASPGVDFASPNSASPNHGAPTAFLPASFAGWELSGSPQLGRDARKIDGTSSSVLTEDRFAAFELATYKRDDRTLTVKAAQFADAAGAYAAFTFYRQPLMRAEDVGTLAASLNERVLFFSGNLLVDARFDRVTGMSGAQLRELAAHLPRASGPAAVLPTLPNYLPREQLVPQTARYLFGPAAYSALNIDLAPDLIDFGKSPELLWARVNGEAPGSAEVLLVAYPTPHIAIAKLAAFEQLSPPISGDLSVARRSGPIVAMVRGSISRGDAGRILDSINYDANVTWNENTGLGKRDNIGGIVVAAITLAAVLFLLSIAVGAFFGAGRFLLPRFRGKRSGEPPDDGEMIRLDLRS